MRLFAFLFLLFPALLLAGEDEQALSRRIYAHVKIHDAASAIREAKLALQTFPRSQEIQRALIHSLCEKGEELEALNAWKSFSKSISDEKTRHLILENLSWGVLRRADHSAQSQIRIFALIGAALTHDARALPILLAALRGSDATLRAIAVHLSISLRDGLLTDELLRLLREERNWYVRMEVIQAVGHMKLMQAKEGLKEIVADHRATAEEKQVAITSLIELFDGVSRGELRVLLKSPYSGLRELACEIVSYFELHSELGSILPLLKDPSSQVRIAALNCLGLLRIKDWKGCEMATFVAPLMADGCAEVSITASWAAALLGEEEGVERLKNWLHDVQLGNRRLAAGAVAILGSRGVSLAEESMRASKDPYVQATLARGLIGQRAHVQLACDCLYYVLMHETKSLWMWDTSRNPIFRTLAPSTLQHTEEFAGYPYIMDQFIRLDLLSVLTQLKYSEALSAVKQFLHHQRSQVVGAAALLLLEEGDDDALELVRQLIVEKKGSVRFQAAITLALFGKDPLAISVLQEMYPQLDHMQKLHVLEALAHIGDPSSIPFFVERLGEPHQTLRVAAASALMQALYH